MSLWVRTWIRVIGGAAFLVLLLFATFKYLHPNRTMVVAGGVSIIAVIALSYAIRGPLRRSVPNLDERAQATWGYAFPRWAQHIVNGVLIVCGGLLISWGLFGSGFPTDNSDF